MNVYEIKINKLNVNCPIHPDEVEKINDDLEKLKAGVEELQDHLFLQDRMLRRLLRYTRPHANLIIAVFTVIYDDGSVLKEATSVEMKINQKFTCTVAFEDLAGNVATVDSAPEWSVDPIDILTIVPSEDGMSVEVTSTTKAGSAQLLCKADADMDDGVTEITGMLSVTVLPGDAVTVRLNPGEVEDATPEA